MPLDLRQGSPRPDDDRPASMRLARRVAELNAALRHHSATDVLRMAVREIPDLALVSSFGAESVALLHLASTVSKNLPVLFIDTELLFTETLVYQQEVAERLALKAVRIIHAGDIADKDPGAKLHQEDADACCALRKTAPLQRALRPFGGWITGRKRFQSGARATLEFFELEKPTDAPARIKVNPLARWSIGDVAQYITENRLPRHPMVAQGYPSIGCMPCTTPVDEGEDMRAGRWRKIEKEECGIHFADGKTIRRGAMT